jgi:hypothetical protein
MASAIVVVLVLGLSACGGEQPTAQTPVAPQAQDVKPVGEVVTVAKHDVAPTTLTATEDPSSAPSPADAGPAPTGPAPKIVCEAPVFEFGEVDSEVKVEHDFMVRNAGEGTLEIKNVRTSCGCTVAQPENKTLAPGQETKISTTLSLKGRQGVTSKTVTVECNDPETPVLKLELKGTAVAAITIEPRTVSLGRVVDASPISQAISIKATKPDLNFKIESVDSSTLPQFKTEIKTVEEGKSYEVLLTSAEALPVGNINGRLMIKTDTPSNPIINVSVFAQVIGDLDVSPDVVSLRHSDDPSKRSNQYMRVRGGRVQEFTVTEVIAPVPTMKAEFEARQPNDYLIKLSEMPLTDELDGKELIIKTSVPTTPEIKIPFRVVKARALGQPNAPDLQKMMSPGGKPMVPPPGGLVQPKGNPPAFPAAQPPVPPAAQAPAAPAEAPAAPVESAPATAQPEQK